MTPRGPENRDLGRRGERLAVDFLKKKGYRIVETNYRTRRGEIDIVCEQGDCLVLVEVKTRRSLAFGQPEEAVDRRKRKKMLDTAARYLALNPSSRRADCRFDVIAIFGNTRRTLRHIEDAFRP
jgi:putative endonuclease